MFGKAFLLFLLDVFLSSFVFFKTKRLLIGIQFLWCLMPKNFGSGDEGIRTPDPLLARQVLSQLSYTPMGLWLIQFSLTDGLKWTRTTDLTLIRRAL